MILLIRKLPWKMHPVLDLKPLGAQQEMESKILQFSVLMPRDVLPYVFTETIVSSREDRGVQFLDKAAVSYMNLERQKRPRWERSRANLALEIKRTGVCSTAGKSRGPRSQLDASATPTLAIMSLHRETNPGIPCTCDFRGHQQGDPPHAVSDLHGISH